MAMSRLKKSAIRLLKTPVSPLMSFVTITFFAGDYQDIGQLIDGIPDSLTIKGVTYERARETMAEYLDILCRQNVLKAGKNLKPDKIVVDLEMKLVGSSKAVVFDVKHSVITRELKRINSLLCLDHGCVECCRGPHNSHRDCFFELPLSSDDLEFFRVSKVNTEYTRSTHAFAEPDPVFEGKKFYAHPPTMYHWEKGWSLILPRETYCPNLDVEEGKCIIYQKRPEVCRLTQIFPLVLDRHYDPKAVSRLAEIAGLGLSDLKDRNNIYVAQNAVLGILDCPYVRELKQEIVDYAALSGLKACFRQNKK